MLHYQWSDSKTILCELQNEIKVFNRCKHSPDLHFHPSKRRAASHEHNLACRKQSMVVANHKWQPIRSEVWRQCRKPVSLCRSANFESFNGWDGSYVLLLMYNDYITENKSFSHTVVSYDFWRLGIKCTK